MLKNINKSLVFAACSLLLTACGFFEKDNTPAPTPLVSFTPEVQPARLWSANAGAGIDKEYLKISPAVSETAIFTTSTNGNVTAIDRSNGRRLWQVGSRLPLSTSPGIGDGIVVVGSRKGDVLALTQSDGRLLWKTSIPGELLAKPAISQGRVIVKAVDGYIRALSTQDGHELWAYQQVEPGLILRGSSAPLIQDRSVIVGFANGNLSRFSLTDGQLMWSQPVAIPTGAFAIQRMIDVDADPIVYEHNIYAATYQGKIASLDWNSGSILWSHDISSYTGMVADNNAIYVTDARGDVWSFTADSGAVNWRQARLESRVITSPAIMGDYIVVGDQEGYLHWLNKRDGHFAARTYVGPMYATPIVKNNILYALTNKGSLAAYTMR